MGLKDIFEIFNKTSKACIECTEAADMRLDLKSSGAGGDDQQSSQLAYPRGRRTSLRNYGRAPGRPVPGGGQNPSNNVQLLSVPQLDVIQRTLKILDVRLQHVQAAAKTEEKMRQDIDHICRVMSENQKALTMVVTVLASIQDEVHSLGVTIQRQAATTFQIQPHNAVRKKSSLATVDIHAAATRNEATKSGGGGGGSIRLPLEDAKVSDIMSADNRIRDVFRDKRQHSHSSSTNLDMSPAGIV